MKKDRNAFFNEANFNSSSFVGAPNIPNMNMNYPMNGNYSGAQASQSFYSGPVPMNYNPTMNNDYLSDFESRMAKIERQINRLDARVSKLESKGLVTTENFDNTTNMYML